MQIVVTDINSVDHTIVHTPGSTTLTINGREISTVAEATEEIDHILSVRNENGSAWHSCPLFFRTDTVLTAFDARTVSSYQIIE
jgi:hypothetical protein